jgi:hypothetical protein
MVGGREGEGWVVKGKNFGGDVGGVGGGEGEGLGAFSEYMIWQHLQKILDNHSRIGTNYMYWTPINN